MIHSTTPEWVCALLELALILVSVAGAIGMIGGIGFLIHRLVLS